MVRRLRVPNETQPGPSPTKRTIMRKLLFLFCGLILTTTLSAQLEVKVNPLGLLFGNFNALVEKGINDNFGVEGQIGLVLRNSDAFGNDFNYNAFNIGAAGKYYFNPREGWDRFYVGGYARFNTGTWKQDGSNDDGFSNTRLALGLLVGQKWVSQGGFVFELGAGVGRAILNDIGDEDFDILLFDVDFLLRLAVGYRFQ